VTAALFVEALTTVRTLGWAALVWFVLLAVAASLAVYAVVVAVAWPCKAARDGLGAALSASQALRALPEHQNAHRATEARTRPSWARTEQEAA
jgi:hypothetical protein